MVYKSYFSESNESIFYSLLTWLSILRNVAFSMIFRHFKSRTRLSKPVVPFESRNEDDFSSKHPCKKYINKYTCISFKHFIPAKQNALIFMQSMKNDNHQHPNENKVKVKPPKRNDNSLPLQKLHQVLQALSTFLWRCLHFSAQSQRCLWFQ